MRSFLYVLLSISISISISVQALPAASPSIAQLTDPRHNGFGKQQPAAASVPLNFISAVNGHAERRRLEPVASSTRRRSQSSVEEHSISLGRRQIRNADYSTSSSPNTLPSSPDSSANAQTPSQNSQAPSSSDTPSEQRSLNSRNVVQLGGHNIVSKREISARLQRTTRHLTDMFWLKSRRMSAPTAMGSRISVRAERMYARYRASKSSTWTK